MFKTLLLSAALSCTGLLHAQTAQPVDQGTATTVAGLGGYTELTYALAKGDVLTLDFRSNKQLDRVLILQYPDQVLGRLKSTRKGSTSVTVPEEGFVVIRFVSDRGGRASIDYTVSRTPGPGAPASYDTRVEYEKATGTKVQPRVPRRAGAGAVETR